MTKLPRLVTITLAALILLPMDAYPYLPGANAQGNSMFFQETGHTVKGRFLDYWQKNGGLPQQGFPISEEIQERSSTDGKTYTVQYFERAVFELHPENSPPYDVLLSLLGVFEYRKNYPDGAPAQVPNTDPGSLLFTQTGKRLGGAFLVYWQNNGGLAQQGYPISDEFRERSALDGKTYTVQYFERAVFEFHPENSGTPYVVLLSQLGTFRFREQYIITVPPATAPINRWQSRPKLSDQYLVWQEGTDAPEGSVDPKTYDVFAMDLRIGKTVNMTADKPGAQTAPSVSGSLVAWSETVGECPDCYPIIVAKDLSSGTEYQVAVERATRRSAPVAAGRSVAWRECQGSTCQILLKNIDGNQRTQTVAALRSSTEISLQMSDEYIVWTDRGSCSGATVGRYPGCIRAYHRKSGVTKPVRELQFIMDLPPTLISPIRYALAGHRLAIGEAPSEASRDTVMGLTAVLNLDTGETIMDPSSGNLQNFAMSGDIIVWDTNYMASFDEIDIWGMDIKENKRKLLVKGKGAQRYPTIAGDWLAWENAGGPNSKLIGAMPLSVAFATAEDRQKTTLPTKQITDTLTSIDMVTPDEGWAVGFGIILRYIGGKWEIVDRPDKLTLRDVSMVSADEGWAVGTLSGGTFSEAILLHYTGGRWNRESLPILLGRDVRELSEVEMVSADEGWAVGDGIMLHYINGRWEHVPLFEPFSDSTSHYGRGIFRISMSSRDAGWAIGAYGRLLYYQDHKWRMYPDWYPPALSDVEMVSADEGWIVGSRVGILRYAGGKWQPFPTPSGITVNRVRMVSATEGWAVGTSGGVLHYKDGTWKLEDPGIRGVGLYDIDMISSQEGWAVGSSGTLLHYVNGRWVPYER